MPPHPLVRGHAPDSPFRPTVLRITLARAEAFLTMFRCECLQHLYIEYPDPVRPISPKAYYDLLVSRHAYYWRASMTGLRLEAQTQIQTW